MAQKVPTQTASPTPKDDPFDFLLGHFGRWQLLILVTVSLIKLSSGWVQMAIFFLTPNFTFWCSSMKNITTDLDTEFVNISYIEIEANHCYDACEKYEYDTTPFENTIISEWDLVCDRMWLASFTQMILQLGVLIGSIVFGFISDRYGRKNTFLFCIITLIALGFGIPFSPSYTTFTTLRFFLGMASAGSMVVSFVIVMESVGAKYREVVGCLYHIPFFIGHMTVPLFAYFFRSWDQYSLAMAVPPLIYLVYFFVLTESPRWLLSMGRVDEATEIVKKLAIMNGRPTTKIEETLNILATEITSASDAEVKANYSDLFRSSLRLKTFCCCIAWLISGVTFYGFNQYISQTSPDPFISVAVAGAIQIPSNFLAMWLIKRFGRKITTVACFVLGGLFIITLRFVPDIFALTLTLGSLGVSCASIVATTLYIYTTELFPTVVRNMGMGASSMSMRIGSMVAPFISNLSFTVPWLPTVIFGLAPIGAGLVCLCLPETKGLTLQDGLEDTVKDKVVKS